MPNRTRIALAAAFLAAVLSGCAAVGPQAGAKHRIVMQVSDDSPKTWNQALNNARNLQSELGKENVDVRIVVYGNGIGMLKMDSEVGNRVKQTVDAGVPVVACQNTMKARKLTQADMHPAASYTPGGIVYIMQRQQEGFAYVRP